MSIDERVMAYGSLPARAELSSTSPAIAESDSAAAPGPRTGHSWADGGGAPSEGGGVPPAGGNVLSFGGVVVQASGGGVPSSAGADGRRLSIAVIAPPWLPVPPPAYGGTETVVDTLAAGLQALGHDVRLIAHPDSACPVPLQSVVPAEDCRQMGRASIEIEHAVGAYALADGADVVSDHTIAGVVYSASYPHLPVVATNHNPFSRTRDAIYGTLVGRGSIVAISESHARSSTLPISAVIHHGLDVSRFPEGSGTGGYLAMLTRMAPDKGVDRAARLARAAGVPLLIAAKARDPLEQEYLDQVVRPLLGGGVEYLGEIGAVEKCALLADATALFNPIAWEEPFGMAMLESFACGTPVIATPRGAAPEIVTDGETGFLAADDDGLLAAIAAVGGLSRSACRERVQAEFSVTAMCRRYVAAFTAAIDRHHVAGVTR